VVDHPESGIAGRWRWKRINENDRHGFQIPDGYPEYVVFDITDDDPPVAFCSAWYDAETTAQAYRALDGAE
jgi:hypothetical protein